MKKFLLGVLCTLGIFASATAQETFRKNDNVLNVGIGLSTYSGTSLPPLSAMYERCLIDGIIDKGSIGLGLQAEIASFTGTGLSLFAGPRVAFHYEFVDNLDTYIGVQAGIAFGDKHLSFGWDGVLGARYYFSEKFGLFGEFGTGLSVFKVGANFRL